MFTSISNGILKKEMSQEEAISWMNEHPYGDCDANGVDISLLGHMLRLTPTQRVRRLSGAARATRNARIANSERFKHDSKWLGNNPYTS